MIFVVTLPSGPVQFPNDSLPAVPTLTGDAPLWVPFGIEPVARDPLVLPLVVHVTLMPWSLSTVLLALAVKPPPPLTFTVRGVDARAGAALSPITARAAPVALSSARALFPIVMNPPP